MRAATFESAALSIKQLDKLGVSEPFLRHFSEVAQFSEKSLDTHDAIANC
jgi:hypothetical protein